MQFISPRSYLPEGPSVTLSEYPRRPGSPFHFFSLHVTHTVFCVYFQIMSCMPKNCRVRPDSVPDPHSAPLRNYHNAPTHLSGPNSPRETVRKGTRVRLEYFPVPVSAPPPNYQNTLESYPRSAPRQNYQNTPTLCSVSVQHTDFIRNRTRARQQSSEPRKPNFHHFYQNAPRVSRHHFQPSNPTGDIPGPAGDYFPTPAVKIQLFTKKSTKSTVLIFTT
jgi:hypothetical protein